MKKFEEYCAPRKDVILERFNFNKCVQSKEEDTDSFLTRLKNIAASCEFGELKEELIRDRIVIGIRGDSVLERLQREKNLTSEGATQIVNTAEAIKTELQELKEKENETAAVDRKTYKPKPHTMKTKSSSQKTETQEQKTESQGKHLCRRCDKVHESKKCPAYGKQCHKCKKMNHFAKYCCPALRKFMP